MNSYMPMYDMNSYRGGRGGNSYQGGGSYGRGGSSYRGGNSYRGNSYQGGYSREGNEQMMERMHQMMENAQTEQERETIRRMMESM